MCFHIMHMDLQRSHGWEYTVILIRVGYRVMAEWSLIVVLRYDIGTTRNNSVVPWYIYLREMCWPPRVWSLCRRAPPPGLIQKRWVSQELSRISRYLTDKNWLKLSISAACLQPGLFHVSTVAVDLKAIHSSIYFQKLPMAVRLCHPLQVCSSLL